MKTRLPFLLLPLFLLASFPLGATAQIVVEDDFDSYADDAAFEAAWSPDTGNGNSPTGGPIGIIVPRAVAPFPVAPFDGSGDPMASPPIEPLVGQAISYSGLGGGINESTASFSIQPTATQAVKLSADIFESGFNNRRFSVGLRDDTNAANLVEMGFWNASALDAFDMNDPPGELPVTGYAYRAVLFGGINGDLQREPNWQYFNIDPAYDDPAIDHNGDGKLGDGNGVVDVNDVGPGWQTYSVTIELEKVTFELDLGRDGTIDASQSWDLTYNSAGFYNSLRIGGPSGVAMNQDSMADNVRLEMVDIVADLACDFNSDTLCDIADLDALYDQLGTTDAAFDLNGNGTVDNLDIPEWLSQASAADAMGRTFKVGDTNLDGSVGGPDFTTLAVNFGATGATWGQGNFDGDVNDREVGGSDFTGLAVNFGFVSAVSTVPEPASLLSLVLGIVLLLPRKRRV